MTTNQPTRDEVWDSIGNEVTVLCPECGDEAFRYVPIGENTSIDTIGSVRVCATSKGSYFH